jgi:hypothetical protein
VLELHTSNMKSLVSLLDLEFVLTPESPISLDWKFSILVNLYF